MNYSTLLNRVMSIFGHKPEEPVSDEPKVEEPVDTNVYGTLDIHLRNNKTSSWKIWVSEGQAINDHHLFVELVKWMDDPTNVYPHKINTGDDYFTLINKADVVQIELRKQK